jgi:predicted nucleic acid-binding protein
VTTNLVIAEVHRLTLHRAGVQPALKALDRMGASASVSIQFATTDDHAAALRWLERLGLRPTTYTDAVSFAVMERTGCRLVLGFDDDFLAAGFSRWGG